MSGSGRGRKLASLLLLRETRRLLRGTAGRLLFGSVSIAYLFVSLLSGRMLVLGRTGQTSTTFAIFASGYPSWNYPEVAVIAPNGILVLPYLATITMALVSVGVGLGMSASALLAYHLVRTRRPGRGVSSLLSGLEGLSPAMIAALTLGACCSTTAASTAGIGLAAQTSGTTVDNLLANSWFLNLLQVFVLGLALLGQEQLIRVYGVVLGLGSSTEAASARFPSVGPRFVLSALLRVALLCAGVLGALAMFLAWTVTDPASAGPVRWGYWLLAYEWVALAALAAALAPRGVLAALASGSRTKLLVLPRAVLLVGGILLLLGVPSPYSGPGAHGLLNELLGANGASSSAGAVAPQGPLGAALYVRWFLVYGLLGGFAVGTALSPRRLLRVLAVSAAEEVERRPGPMVSDAAPKPEEYDLARRSHRSPSTGDLNPAAELVPVPGQEAATVAEHGARWRAD
ncbi:MAG: hypothetical protein L3K13_04235 [Thermoplasmata archaeon]|nr:hypothetical protein [Thermoplasmata archaeon]